MLHGPPGSGKTSYIQALAGALQYDICILNLSERGLGDDKLIHLLSNVPERCFILIEDVDAAFNKRVQTSEDGYVIRLDLFCLAGTNGYYRYQSSVTFSGFLNALDGVASGEERVIFMTTNHLEKLDPALIRPGRVDLSVLVDDANPSQAKRLFKQFYGETESPETLSARGQDLESLISDARQQGRPLSMATLQGLFIRNTAASAVEACREITRR